MSKRKIILFVVLIAVLSGGYWWKNRDSDKSNAPMAPGPVPVRVMEAVPRDVPITMNGIGNVESLNHVVVRAQVDGELMAVHFTEGQNVEKGALLAEIDDRRIAADLSKAKAEKASAVAQLNTARQDLKRYQNLLQDDAIASQRVDQQKAAVEQLSAAVQVAQAAIDSANVQLSYTKVTAPISGTVGLRRIDAGNIVKASDEAGLITITQMDPINVVFTLQQNNLNDLVPLMQTEHRPVDILSKEGDTPIAMGQLQTIDNQIDQTTGTIRLKAVVPNESKQLWPGQFVVARIRIKVLEHAISVPLTALQRGQDGVFVYRLNGVKAEVVNVKVVYEDSEQAVIDGVKEGDRIVIDGQLRIRPNSDVQIIADAIEPQDQKDQKSEEDALETADETKS